MLPLKSDLYELSSATLRNLPLMRGVMFDMRISKEASIGMAVTLIAIGILAVATGAYGILYIAFALIIMVVSIKLFFRKSVASKTGAIIINPDIAYKILMPSKYKKAIKELEHKERHENT